MNYKPNKIDWKDGDIVIHDADAKKEHMLMKVVGTITFGRKKTYKTKYVNGGNKIWCNRKEVLHNPERFGLKIIRHIHLGKKTYKVKNGKI